MGRKTSSQVDLQESLEQLDKELSRPEIRVSAVKAIETKISVLNDILKREAEAKQESAVQEAARLKEDLSKYTNIDPAQVVQQAEELRTLRGQNETLRNSNNSYSREAVTAKGEIENLKSGLRWMCEQVSPEARLNIAVRCFCVKHAAGRTVIDFLLGNDTTTLWLKNTHSKTAMVQRVRDLKHSVDADDQALISFLLLYAKEKYQWDIEAQLKDEAMERARRENEADRQRGEMQQAMEIARNKRMRENSRELEIMRTEAGLEPVSRVTPEYF